MDTQSSPLAGTSQETQLTSAAAVTTRAAWQRSIWFDLILALIAGFSYALLVMGPQPLNPRNVNWVAFDPAYHYIGWELFRQDPHLHWPLTHTDRLGYPQGESVALLDLNPLMALALKPLSPLLPEPAQYFGIEVILACTLQFFFAFRLFRILIGPDVIAAGLCSLFFLLAPPLNYRFWGHYSLSNQWVLLAALYLFARAQQSSPNSARRFAISAALLTAITVGINPYLAFGVLVILAAGVVSLLWQKRMSVVQSAGVMTLLLAVGFAVAYSFGLVISGGKGYASGGYRDMSLNLLSPFDPRGWTSVIFPQLHGAAAGQYEGYNYLGAGILFLAAVVLICAFIRKNSSPLDKRWLVPLSVACLLLTLLALSTKVTLGARTLLDVDPQNALTPYLAPLRASGRLFWGPYYAMVVAILAAPFFLIRRTWATLLVAAMLVLQFVDTTPAPPMGAHHHHRRTSVALEVASLGAAGIASSEPHRPSRVAMRA